VPTLQGRAARPGPAGVEVESSVELLKLFLAEKRDPEPFHRHLATRTVAGLRLPVEGRLLLDLGCGSGYYAEALVAAGARVVPTDLGLWQATDPPAGLVISDALALCFADGSFDGVFCSNLLEHTPDPERLLAEIERILRPGGWAWVSWCNWYSPWGGHEIVPFHYLGPRLGLKVWRRLFGEPPRNVPFETLWPTHIGKVLAMVRRRPGLRLLDARPRYYPSQRWLLKVPGLREVATWNCLLLLERMGVAPR
jgi:SAM-dependent methyltransferase